ncbi:DNA polymerase III subunit gamma/tau [Amygdalobacter nucleatus]|uniref:DNA polymerase III subunit gamma/tau n=1 Tax=Amygdalobacter nucleatus TaxID=3029274 RepID=UPI0027A20C97|nr:DNA polymerase III subunit gamma/tau [Amygdalobacter nucleatus]WEG36758.1 DNA polymerase III subunit gamma/tau [Amygdalobacter nucleatus]
MQQDEHQALYRKWRPKNFNEVCGQTAITGTLRQAVINGEISHAYLFAGTRGTGKTSLAKIFSRAINCLKPENGNPCNQCSVCQAILEDQVMDVIEMDAASNNSVDNIRRLIEEVPFLPALARYKVYIIDEVHMLSVSAFNALLKTLEEPPQHVVFILATTEPEKIPATILSRCQRYNFQRLANEEVAEHLTEIAKSLNLDIEPACLQTIIKLADGSMRDAISLLDQCRISVGLSSTLTLSQLEKLLGKSDRHFVISCLQAILARDVLKLTELINDLALRGLDYTRFLEDLAYSYRQLLLVVLSGVNNDHSFLGLEPDLLTALESLATNVNADYCLAQIQALQQLISNLRYSAQARLSLEIGLLSLLKTPNVNAQASAWPSSEKFVVSTYANPQVKKTVETKLEQAVPAKTKEPVVEDVPTREYASVAERELVTKNAPLTENEPVTTGEALTESASGTENVSVVADVSAAQNVPSYESVSPIENMAEQKDAPQASQQTTIPSTASSAEAQTDNLEENKCQADDAKLGCPTQAEIPANLTDTEADINETQTTLFPEPPANSQAADDTVEGTVEDTVESTVENTAENTVKQIADGEELAQTKEVASAPNLTKAKQAPEMLDLHTLSDKLVQALQADKQIALSFLISLRPLEQEGNIIYVLFSQQEKEHMQITESDVAMQALQAALEKVTNSKQYKLQVVSTDELGNIIKPKQLKQLANSEPEWLKKLREYANAEQLSFDIEEKQADVQSEW